LPPALFFVKCQDSYGISNLAKSESGRRWPLLVLEEAQNFSASALEEVRLGR
jgi:hypothetical protein